MGKSVLLCLGNFFLENCLCHFRERIHIQIYIYILYVSICTYICTCIYQACQIQTFELRCLWEYMYINTVDYCLLVMSNAVFYNLIDVFIVQRTGIRHIV